MPRKKKDPFEGFASPHARRTDLNPEPTKKEIDGKEVIIPPDVISKDFEADGVIRVLASAVLRDSCASGLEFALKHWKDALKPGFSVPLRTAVKTMLTANMEAEVNRLFKWVAKGRPNACAALVIEYVILAREGINALYRVVSDRIKAEEAGPEVTDAGHALWKQHRDKLSRIYSDLLGPSAPYIRSCWGIGSADGPSEYVVTAAKHVRSLYDHATGENLFLTKKARALLSDFDTIFTLLTKFRFNRSVITIPQPSDSEWDAARKGYEAQQSNATYFLCLALKRLWDVEPITVDRLLRKAFK